MERILNKNLFFIKEHVGLFKAANNYDIFDPSTGEMLLLCREENLGFFTKLFRFSDYKRMTPFNLVIRDDANNTLLTVKRGVTWFRSIVNVYDGNNQLIGTFRQKMLTIGGGFTVFSADGSELCVIKGKWTSWNFKFLKDNIQFAEVSKKWAGIGKELFTTADNYMLSIADNVPENHPVRPLILAAVMCIDLVLKE